MIPVAEALDKLFALVSVAPEETVPLSDASGRVLARPVAARRDQPPFAASAMDGYALGPRPDDPRAGFRVIGEAAAGHGFAGTLGAGEAVRIFTGAPVPAGADRVLIQEDARREGDRLHPAEAVPEGAHIRPAGDDFRKGDRLEAPRILAPGDVALLASMNIAEVPVRRRPDVALMATGDELVMPGEEPGPDQIIASNSFGLKAMLEGAGARVRMLPIARDNAEALRTGFGLARGADLVVTIGGASVGDHDLVGEVAGELGMERAFYKVAMRPGKPLMAGRMEGAAMVGLPGNPVSAMVCGQIFLLPLLRAMQGFAAAPLPRRCAPLAEALPANGPREHYMRGRFDAGTLRAFGRQDSALLTVLSEANALIVRPPKDPARAAGEELDYIPI